MKQHHLLLVEDGPDIQMVLNGILGSHYQLTIVATAKEAKQLLSSQTFALIVLDVQLPDGDGFELCVHIRSDPAHRNIPIVFLTGKEETRDKVMAFALGADDYVVKPINALEFKARIGAKLRRADEESENRSILTQGPFRIYLPQQRVVSINDSQETNLNLSTLEFKLFCFFLRHEEHVLSRAQILDGVWGANTHVTDRVVDTYVYALRKKLGKFSKWIKSVPRIGYSFSPEKSAIAA